MEDLGEMVKLIGGFVLLILVVTAIHSLLSLPLFYGIVMRKNPYKYQFNMAEVTENKSNGLWTFDGEWVYKNESIVVYVWVSM